MRKLSIIAIISAVTGYLPAADVTGDRANIGISHSLSGTWATIGGGAVSTNASTQGTIAGGVECWIMTNSPGAVISGGGRNIIYTNAGWTAINGGLENRIYSDAVYAWIGGGSANEVEEGAAWGSIGGGFHNIIEASAGSATISGGYTNMIDEASSGATIGGGINNYIGMDSPWAGVFGGLLNKIGSDSPASFLGGGQDNSVLTDASHAFLGGGVANVVRSNTLGCSIIGGRNNTVVQQAESSAVFAGAFNQVTGTNSAAGGHRAQALHNGTFVWGDGTDADIASTNANSVTMRATGGYRLFSSTSPSGVYLAAGSGSWTSLSDRNAKENLEPINPRQVLEKVAGLKVSKWNYKAQPDAIRHIGPMAQDFTAAFGVGESDTGITSIDADGVALAAIQGLHELVKEKDAALKEQQKTVDELSTRLRALEKVLLNEVSAK